MQLGKYGHAQDFATRVLDREPANADALALRAAAHLGRRDARAALADAHAWLATSPDEPRAHYTAGKCLLSLGRLGEARAAFARAPQLVEAMVLRREAERMLGEVRAATGVAAPMTLGLPEHLGELRELLIAGRTDDAIAILRGESYATDALAQLVLGELLLAAQHADDALACFDRALAADPALHDACDGRARALAALDRPAEAEAAARAYLSATAAPPRS